MTVILATVAVASAPYVAIRPTATYGNYVSYNGYGGEGSYGQTPYGYGYPSGEREGGGYGYGGMG